jgi:hypothetical protein
VSFRRAAPRKPLGLEKPVKELLPVPHRNTGAERRPRSRSPATIMPAAPSTPAARAKNNRRRAKLERLQQEREQQLEEWFNTYDTKYGCDDLAMGHVRGKRYSACLVAACFGPRLMCCTKLSLLCLALPVCLLLLLTLQQGWHNGP